MCGPPATGTMLAAQKNAANPDCSGSTAGTSLARLMERQLGYQEGHIDPIALRLFIRAYWTRVSTYAHAIHDEV